MLQIWIRPSKNLKKQPENWERLMHSGQKPDPNPENIYAQCAET
jgi:hypothetical protein